MRAFYQFIVWRSAEITEPDIPSPTDPGSGWLLKDGELLPLTMSKDAIHSQKLLLKLYHVSVTPVLVPKGVNSLKLNCVVLVSVTSNYHQVIMATVCDMNRTHVQNKFVLKY